MTDESYVTCNGERLTALTVNVANIGPWLAELEFIDAPALSGRVEIKVGETLTMVGTVVAAYDGTHLEQRRCRVVGGAGGWGRPLARKHYHNDLGVKTLQVITDAAREVGETLGEVALQFDRVGRDYVRQAGSTAARVLENEIGNVAWWVDYAGVTHVGPRPSAPLDREGFDVLMYDPRSRLLTLSVDDPSIIGIGAVISQPPLEAPQTIREYDLHVDGDTTRVVAWCGGDEQHRGRLAGLMQAIARRVTEGTLFGKYRYRVVAMRSDGRVELQAVRKDAGLPDMQPIAQWPGVAGTHAELALGAECLVEFIEGDPTQPIVTHYAGKGGPGFVPVTLTLGGDIGAPCARQGDAVEVLLPPAVFSGTISGAPASGVLTFPLIKTLGIITAGSSKVKVAT